MKVAESQAVEEDKGGGELPGMIPPTEDNTTADDTAVHEDRANANIDGDEDKALSGHETPPEAATDRSDNGTGTGAHTPDTQPSKSVEHSMGTENDDEQKKSGEQSLQDGSHVAGEVNVTESLAPVGSASTSPPEGSEVQTAASTDTPSDETSKTHEASEGSKASDQVERLNTNNGEIASEIKAEALPPGANGTEKQQNITNQGEEIKQTVPNGHDGVNSNGDQGNGTDLQHTNGNLTHREGGNGYSSKEAIDKVNGGKQSGKASRLVKLIQTSSADSMGDLLDEDDGSMKLKRRSSLFAGLMSRGAGIRRRSSNFSIDSMSSVATKLSTIQTIAWLKVKAKKATRVKRKSCLKHESVLQSESNSNIAKIQRVRFSLPKKKTVTSKSIFFDPNHIWMGRWHMFFVLPLAYEIWAGGFRLAFADPDSNTWIFDLDLTCDLLFIVDAAIYLNTMIMVGDESRLQGRNEHAMYIKDRTIIAKKYFLHVFPYQLLPGIVFLSISKPSTHIGVWWVIMFLRLLPRALRLYRYFRSMEINLEVSVNQLQLVKFSLVIAMASHWIGSLYFWAARIHQVEETWLYELDTIFPLYSMNSSTIAQNYLLCLYKGFDGLSSIGYIPIVPNNSFEMVLSVLVMYNSILISAYILGSLFHYLLVSQKDPLTEAHKKRMTDVIAFAEARRLAPAVRKKLIQHFEFQYKKSVQRKASASLKLPRSLEVKVANSRFRPTVEKCCKPGGIFYHCNAQFLNNLVTHLRPVFLMPGDQFIRASEMVLELSFVIDGHAEVVDEDEVKRIIRSDIDDPSVIGDVSFFLGVQQQYSVRAPLDTDIELLVLSKESGEELFRNYPEQQELVSNNILASFNLDKFGNDKSDEKSAEDGEEDPEYLFMRNLIRDTVKRRQEESFLALSYAATAGDLEEVRRMLRKGVSVNSTNYDGKTIMHMAASQGNYRVVELLLEEGAEKNQKDRWGNTPLQDAVNANQGPVIQLLVQWKSELNTENSSDRLCNAASIGDLDTLKLMLEHGLSPNVGNCDQRTPLHLASAEGHNKLVEYILSKGGDVNAHDRWGRTPLQDAVAAGHVSIAEEIYTRGGNMSETTGPVEICNAATEGDVRHLRLLHRCGVDPDTGNYDQRCPLHLAASKGRLLAVNFLLGVSANPNVKDRWGGTPLDDCVRGGTTRHLMCAKLLQSMGGKLGVLADTEEGKRMLQEVAALDMEEVRDVVKDLIAKGLNNKKPLRPTVQQFLVAREASLALLNPVVEMTGLFQNVGNLLLDNQTPLQRVYEELKSGNSVVAKITDKVNDCKLGPLETGVHAVIEIKQEGAESQTTEFYQKLESGLETSQFIQSFVDQDTLALYDELDLILANLQKKERDSKFGKLSLAKDFNKCLMNLSKVEDMWCALTSAFHAVGQHSTHLSSTRSGYARGVYVDAETFPELLKRMQLDLSPKETRELFMNAVSSLNSKKDGGPQTQITLLTPEILLCKCEDFRELVRKECDENSVKLSTLVRSHVLRSLSFAHIQYLAWRCKKIVLEEGGKIKPTEPCMYLVRKGRVRGMFHNDGKDICLRLEYGPNTIFGEVWLLTGFAPVLMIRAQTQCELIQVSKRDLAVILQAKAQLIVVLANALTKNSEFDTFEKEILRDSINHKLAQDPRDSEPGVEISELELNTKVLMDSIHEHFEPNRTENVNFIALIVSVWRGIAKINNRRSKYYHCEDVANMKQLVDQGIHVIESAWDLFAAGLPTVEYDEVAGIKDYLGEVGQNFFATTFNPRVCPKTMDMSDWFTRWTRYIDDSESTQNDTFTKSQFASFRMRLPVRENSQELELEEGNEEKVGDSTVLSIAQVDPSTYLEKLKEITVSIFHQSITPWLLNDDLANAYEPTFTAIVGNTMKPMTRAQVPAFLSLLLLDFHSEISNVHVDEFMQTFSPDGRKATSISFPDIERVLYDKNATVLRADRLFIGDWRSALNPLSTPVRAWRTLQQFCAVLYFLQIPAWISFQPYSSMTTPSLLIFDLLLDICVFTNLFVCFNVAYMNKQSRWVTERTKIARHYLSHDFWLDLISAAPLDWFGWLSGASIEMCSWFRLPKMLYVISVNKDSKMSLLKWNMTYPHFKLALYIFGVLHVTSCLWFLLGRRGAGELLGEATWYSPADVAVRRASSIHLSGVIDYSGYGMLYSNHSGTWDRYLLSLYWISSTVSATGVIGDMFPKNYGEIAYTIFLLCLNLTLFNYVIGEISASVLKGDEKLVKAREELGAVESYLQGFDLPNELKVEIRRYFEGTSGGTTFISASEIFDSISHSLRLEISSNMTRECLENVSLFQGCSPQLKANIQGLLREAHFGSDEYLYQSNMMAHEMYFVVNGFVDQLVQDSEGFSIHDKSVGPGGSVGDLSFFFGVRHINAARASSRSGAICLRLVRSQIMPVLKAYPDDEEIVAQNALKQFQLTKHARSAAGTSRYAKSNASFGTHGTQQGDQLQEDEAAKEKKDDEEVSLPTDYEHTAKDDNNFDAIILSNIEQKVADLNQRRKAEHIAAFCGAAARGELEKMQRFFRIGLHVDETDANGRTALHVASCEGQMEAVKLLLAHRALASIKDKYHNTALNDAVRHCQDAVAATLRAQGQSLSFPGQEGGILMCKYASAGDKLQILRMLANGIEINVSNYDSRTALHLAASQGNTAVVEYLLEKKAEVNVKDRMGGTPLADALRHGHVQIQSLLRSAGAQLLGMDTAVAMCNAAAVGDVDTVQALIRNGANPDAADMDKRTALHLAASNGEVTVLDFLLRCTDRNINVNPVDDLGGTPLEDAYRHDQPVAIAMLEAAGGLRMGDSQLLAMGEQQKKDVEEFQKNDRLPRVTELVEQSTEMKIQIWVRGRCGKLIPNKLKVIASSTEQMLMEMKMLMVKVQQLWDNIDDIMSGKETPADKVKDIKPTQSFLFSQLSGKIELEEVRQMAVNFLQTLWSWHEPVNQMLGIMSEDLPSNRVVRLTSAEYRRQADRVLELFKRLVVSTQFFDQNLREMLKVLNIVIDDMNTVTEEY